MIYGMFEGTCIEDGEKVQGMLIEYGGDVYIQVMLGYTKKNEGEFDERFGDKVLQSSAYKVDYDSVVQIKNLEDYLDGHSDFEQHYHKVIDND